VDVTDNFVVSLTFELFSFATGWWLREAIPRFELLKTGVNPAGDRGDTSPQNVERGR